MKLSEVKNTKSSKFNINLSPMYKLERKLNYKPLIIFSIIAGVLLFINIAVFPFIDTMLKNLSKFFEGNPEMIEVFESMNDISIATYFSQQASQSWVLIGTIYASFLGCTIITRDFKNGSFEFIYTQNVSRTKILLDKVLRLVINVVLFNLVCFVFGLVALLIWGYGQFNFGGLVVYLLINIIICLQVGMLSFSISTFATRKYSTILSIILVVLLSLISNIGAMGSDLQFIGYFSPLTNTEVDLLGAGIGEVNWIILSVWTVISVVLSYLGIRNFKNIDLN